MKKDATSQTQLKTLSTFVAKHPSAPKTQTLSSLWWRISLEILLIIILFLIFRTLIWHTMINLGKTFWSCKLYDPGFLKSPDVVCDINIFMGDYVELIMEDFNWFTSFSFFLLIFLIFLFPISIPTIGILGFIVSFILHKYLKKSLNDKNKIIKFPILTRLLLKTLASFFNRKKK